MTLINIKTISLPALCGVDNGAREKKSREKLDAITIVHVSEDASWTVKTKKMGLDLGCILKVIPIGLADKLTMGHEEREESKMTTRYFS